ncbi:MAG: outer membrane protein assembly factor BamB family protein [Limisphaerales bacterium]
MNSNDNFRWLRFAPLLVGVAGLVALALWLTRGSDPTLILRLPGADAPPGVAATGLTNAVLAGKLTPGDGIAATNLPGSWPGFRGPDLTGASTEKTALARSWPAGGPPELWSLTVGEGYAGPAVWNGRVYLMDYDRETKQDALRCLSLADGREIWRFAYPVSIKRNHGITRTVPVVTANEVIAIGPKGHVSCLNPVTGELRWGLDMVKQFGTTIPPWYTGQCPLIDGDRLILAPAGPEALVAALELATGKVLWQSPNPRAWKMTHSSVTPVDFAGRRQYVYCGSHGAAGVAAADGTPLWDTTEWKISIATVPSPVPLEQGRIFLAGGYDAGAMMLQLQEENGQVSVSTLYRLAPGVFGSTQHTPIYHAGHLFGTRPDGRFVCLDPAGKIVWTSERGTNFGLGPYLLADGAFLVMNSSGKLTLIEASTERYAALAEAKVLDGMESWGPLALVGGRLLARDLTRLICLDVGAR